jgi:hypothetical protein
VHAVWQTAGGLSQVQGMQNLLQKPGAGWFDPGCQEGQLVEQGLVYYDDRSDCRLVDTNPKWRPG